MKRFLIRERGDVFNVPHLLHRQIYLNSCFRSQRCAHHRLNVDVELMLLLDRRRYSAYRFSKRRIRKVKMRKTEQHRRIVLAERDVEGSLGSARWSRWAETSLCFQSVRRSERAVRGHEPIPGYSASDGHLLLKHQGQCPAKILVEHFQHRLFGDAWRKDASVAASDAVALRRGPMAQAALSVPFVQNSVFTDVSLAGVDGIPVGRCPVLPVQQTELIVRQLFDPSKPRPWPT